MGFPGREVSGATRRPLKERTSVLAHRVSSAAQKLRLELRRRADLRLSSVDRREWPIPEAAGADFSAPVDFRQLTVTQVVVTSLTLDLPAPGVVILNSGGYAVFNANPSSVACSITKGTNISHQPQVYAQNHNDPNAKRMPNGACHP